MLLHFLWACLTAANQRQKKEIILVKKQKTGREDLYGGHPWEFTAIFDLTTLLWHWRCRLDNPEMTDSYTTKEGSAGVKAVPKRATYVCCLGVQGQVN